MKFQNASTARAGRQPSWRSRVVLGLLGLSFVLVLGRAFYLQTYADEFLKKKGESRYSRVIDVPANRGRILDRNGEPLAVSTPVRSIWALPKEFDPSQQQLNALARILELHPRELTQRVAVAKGDFAYLRRQVAPEVSDKVEELGIPGVFNRREYRRYYPGGDVMAHVLGFTGRDDIGQEGVERAFQEHLAGKSGTRRVIKDGLRRVIEDVESMRPAREGRDLMLALDSRIQSLAHRSLGKALSDHKAASGSVVVLDSTTGEVLALANLPAYNPNNLELLARGAIDPKAVRNRAVSDTFEPGSTLKPFTVAIALEQGKVSAQTTIQTAPGTFAIGSSTIRDAHPAGLLTVAEIIQKSSNVGTAKIAMGLASESMWNMFDGVGFGVTPKLGFLGEAAGRVRPLKTWKPIEQATMSYGHGISVSLIHLARAYTVFAREGDMVPISLTKVSGPVPGKPVITAKTALEIRTMLEMAVQPGGTAPRAQVMGYRVGGKTGTARKIENNHYTPDKHVASFVGLAPLSRPRLVIAVMIDEPRAGQYYGGVVAAPVFAEVMAGALRILGVSPDAPMKPIALPPPGAEVKEST